MPRAAAEKTIDMFPGTSHSATEEADPESLDGLALEDFAADFSRVELPTHDGPWNDQEMQTAVHTFLGTLERR
jgi:hypothetical protein